MASTTVTFSGLSSALDLTELPRTVRVQIGTLLTFAGGGGTVQSIVAGDNVSVDSADPANPVISSTASGTVQAVAEGTNITVDATDPANPIVAAPDVATTAELDARGLPAGGATLDVLAKQSSTDYDAAFVPTADLTQVPAGSPPAGSDLFMGIQGATLVSYTISQFDTLVEAVRLDQMAKPTATVDMNFQAITNVLQTVQKDGTATHGFVQYYPLAVGTQAVIGNDNTADNLPIWTVGRVSGVYPAAGLHLAPANTVADVHFQRSGTNAAQIVATAGVTLNGPLAMGASKITGLANGVSATDAAAFGQIPTGALASLNTVGTAQITDSSVTSVKIADGTIVNADLSATAAVALSKLSWPSDSSHVTMGDGSTFRTAGQMMAFLADAAPGTFGFNNQPVTNINNVALNGMTGATGAVRWVGGTSSGAPVSGTFLTGDMVLSRDGHIFVCTAGGSPGTWVDAGTGGGSLTAFASLATGASTTYVRGDATLATFNTDVRTNRLDQMAAPGATVSFANFAISNLLNWTQADGTATHGSAVSQTLAVGSQGLGWNDNTADTFPHTFVGRIAGFYVNPGLYLAAANSVSDVNLSRSGANALTIAASVGVSLNGPLAMGTKKITGLGLASASTDGASLANKVSDFAAAGADIAMGTHKLTGLSVPSAAGQSVRYEGLPRILFTHFADTGVGADTTEDDLYSDTLAAGQFATNGDLLHVTYSGTTDSNTTGTKRIRAYVAGTVVFDSTALTPTAAGTWTITLTVIRESSTALRVSAYWLSSGFSNANVISNESAFTKISGLTLSNTQIVKVTGQNGTTATANRIVASLGALTYVPAAL